MQPGAAVMGWSFHRGILHVGCCSVVSGERCWPSRQLEQQPQQIHKCTTDLYKKIFLKKSARLWGSITRRVGEHSSSQAWHFQLDLHFTLLGLGISCSWDPSKERRGSQRDQEGLPISRLGMASVGWMAKYAHNVWPNCKALAWRRKRVYKLHIAQATPSGHKNIMDTSWEDIS